MPEPKFEEKFPGHNAGGYNQTNEEPNLFRKMLRGMRFERAAGICSGGEIPLMVLLPKAKEVVAVDHAYMALAAAYTKALLLNEVGPIKLRESYLAGKTDSIGKAIAKVKKRLPEALAKTDPYVTPGSLGELKYNRVPPRAVRRLGNLTLVHGDISDLSQYGVFDLLYVSNAMEHTNRAGKSPTIGSFAPLVKDGGLLLFTDWSNGGHRDPHWEQVTSIKGVRTGWYHRMMKRVTPPVVTVPAPAGA